jgi:hypothetical protein
MVPSHHDPVPTCEEIASISDSVDRAACANDLIWNGHPRPTKLRELRAEALRAALQEGRDAEDLATRLGVRTADIAWMTRRDQATWPARTAR